MVSLIFIHSFFSICWVFSGALEVKTLLCIGDSITKGSGSSDPFHNYPFQLSRLLNSETLNAGIHYDVINLGVSGATVQSNQEHSYWNTSQFARASQYSKNASVILILMGTNDSKQSAWNVSRFYIEYTSMVRHFKEFESRPRVYVVIPPPIYGDYPVEMFEMSSAVINQYFPTHLPVLAIENGVSVINVFKDMGGRLDGSVDPKSRGLFIDDSKPIAWPNDGCHPNNKGYSQLARIIFNELSRLPIGDDSLKRAPSPKY